MYQYEQSWERYRNAGIYRRVVVAGVMVPGMRDRLRECPEARQILAASYAALMQLLLDPRVPDAAVDDARAHIVANCYLAHPGDSTGWTQEAEAMIAGLRDGRSRWEQHELKRGEGTNQQIMLDNRARVLQALRDLGPMVATKDISDRVGLSERSTRTHLEELAEMGVVVKSQDRTGAKRIRWRLSNRPPQ